MENQALLLVDDEEDVRETFKLWLEDEGYTVHTASCSQEALQVLGQQPIAVCLVDLKMKDENGIKVSSELKKIDDLLKIIIFTGYPTYETAIDAMKTGVFDYISKSADSYEILKRIKNALKEHQQEIEQKTGAAEEAQNIVLVCHHAMIKEGFEKFCREDTPYNLMHVYHSIDYIRKADFNNKASLLLICMTCNQAHLERPAKTFSQLKYYFPHARIMMINSQFSEEEQMELIKLGVKGFLAKNAPTEKMVKAFEAVLGDQMWASREVTQRLLSELLAKTSEAKYKNPENKYKLSNREVEILQIMASGLSNFEIANKLFISEKTVKAHIYHIFKKMKVKSRTQAIMKAVKAHII
jgi:DNA-binding NarL/FixJ family response regulator